jgi:nitrogen PTS system EIIA component
MKFIDILEPGRVIHRLGALRREDVLRELVQKGFLQDGAKAGLGKDDEERVVRVLEERERLGSTGIKDGLAIPHGKLEGLPGLIACLGLHDKGLDFGALDGQPSRIFIVLLAPETAGGLHLKALARISRLFSDPAFHRRLLEAPSGPAIYEEVAAEDARY